MNKAKPSVTPRVIEPGIVAYLMQVAAMDGRHYARAKAEYMNRVLREITEHSLGGDSLELLTELQQMIELAVL